MLNDLTTVLCLPRGWPAERSVPKEERRVYNGGCSAKKGRAAKKGGGEKKKSGGGDEESRDVRGGGCCYRGHGLTAIRSFPVVYSPRPAASSIKLSFGSVLSPLG